MEINHLSNNGTGITKLKDINLDRRPFHFEKKKKNKHVGLYTLQNLYTEDEYRWVSTLEFELVKALSPNLYLKLSHASMLLAYEDYNFNILKNNTYEREYLNITEQSVYIRLNRWNNVTYVYKAKFNLTGLIKQLRATDNLMAKGYIPLKNKPSLIQVLTQIYYNPNYVINFMQHPREYLVILQDTDFYHYFKMLHPETEYMFEYTDTD